MRTKTRKDFESKRRRIFVHEYLEGTYFLRLGLNILYLILSPKALAYGRLSKINILADKPIPAERTRHSRRAVGMGLSPRFLNLDFATVGQGFFQTGLKILYDRILAACLYKSGQCRVER